MRFNFRKISAIAVSALMTGMTMGAAAAANYPAPFVSGGTADVAIVYGTGSGVSDLDLVQAGKIEESLGTFVDGGEVTVEGGESFTLDKDSNHFNYNNALNAVFADLDDENMDFLADGDYDDGSIDTTFTQNINLSAKTLTLFADSNYNDKEPTLGFKWNNGDNLLNYNIEFDDTIPFADLEDTDMPLMGNTYYVLDTTSTSIELLDSAEKVILTEGDSVVVGDKTVSIEFIDSDEVKLNVDGYVTDKLMDHGYEELDDGSYIVANEVMYNSKDSGISSVELSIGKGKLSLVSGEDIELNDVDVDGLVVTLTTNTTAGFLDQVNVAWNSDEESFLTEEDALTMPLFEQVKLVLGGMAFPEEPEEITLENGESMTLNMGNYNLPLFWFDDAVHVTGAGYLGEEDYQLVTATGDLTANYTAGNQNTTALSGGMDLIEGNRFLVTSLDTDLSDIDTLYYEVSNINLDGADMLVELSDLIGTKDITFDALTDTSDQGDVTVSVVQINDTRAYLKFAATSGTINYNTAVSDKGMEVTLPAKNGTSPATNNFVTGVALTFTEANKDDDLGKGMPFTVTVKNTSNAKLHASTTNVTTLEDAADVFIGYVPSDLASKITHDQVGDEYEFTVDYYGKEVTADVIVVAGAATISSGSNVLGNIKVKDTEVASVADKNLIVVGGSCINTAAAALVGGAKCGAAWTAATGVGAGQFLIKGYATSDLTDEGKVALLVAGYDAADTVKATTYLTNKEVDTSKAYKGTTSTEVAVVID